MRRYAPTDPLLKFKADTLYACIDIIGQQPRKRFTSRSNSVCKDVSLFCKRRLEEIGMSDEALQQDVFLGISHGILVIA